ncbi:hypothetical protein [Nocardia tengchongensis]|uniref:hypothetical protein n=1 Tax=Nocardia tengchongensis TaxID=2055889 RepID=UPI0036D0F05E
MGEPNASQPIARLDGYEIVLDRQTTTGQILRPGHLLVGFPLGDGSPFEPTSQIARTTYRVRENTLTIETTTGDRIVAEMPAQGDAEPRRDRPSVYLDQNQWSALYKAKQVIGGLPPKEQRAAEWLIEQAESKRVILPLSAGHMSETCQWSNGGERYALAVQMLRLSAGWQLRDPLAVRQDELTASMLDTIETGDQLVCRPAVTLEPFATHAGRQQPGRPCPDDLVGVGFELDALISIASCFDTMLDAESISQNPDSGWVARNQKFTDWLGAQENCGRELIRKRTFAFFLADTHKEVAIAAHDADVPTEQVSSWVSSRMETEVSKMPSLGLFREILHDKLVDRQTRWNSNDLTDMLYLTCGMAYCDYTVGEKSLISRARQSLRRLERPDNVFRRLSDCVPVLADRIGERFAG